MPSDPRRILYLDHAPIFGGAEVVLLNLMRELDRAHWEPIAAIGPDSPFGPALAAAQIETVTLPYGRLNQAGAAMPFNLLRAAQAVVRVVKKRQIALVHSNTVRTHIVGSAAAPFVRAPLVWSLRDNTLPRRVAQLLAPIPSGVTTDSTWLRDVYAPSGLAHKIHVLPNGLALDTPLEPAADLREKLHIPADAPLVATIGRVVAGKAPHLLAQAARQVAAAMPQAYFAIVGGEDRLEPGQRRPEYPDYLARVVQESQLGERLIVTGYWPRVEQFYAAADLIVYCAVQPEGLPTVLLEAMRYAKPVVAAAIGGALEIVKEGETGRLVPPGDSGPLGVAVLDLLQNPSQARQMGLAGEARLRSHFALRDQVAKIERLYSEILDGAP